MSARTSKEVLGGVLVEMQTINNQTVKIAQVLLSNSVFFLNSKKFNCFSTSDISKFQIATVLQLWSLLAVGLQL